MAKRKNPGAVWMGKRGGKARMASLTPKERKALASRAARIRWDSKKPAR